MGEVLYLDMPMHPKFVLIALADNADEDVGMCWPSQRLTAFKASITQRRLRDNLNWLETNGWIEEVRKPGGRGKVGIYRLSVSRIRREAEEQRQRIAAEKGTQRPPFDDEKGTERPLLEAIKGDVASEKGTLWHIKGDVASPRNIREPSIETSREPTVRRNRAAKAEPRPPDLEKLLAKFGDVWTADEVGERCEEALAHSAAKKATDLTAYCRNWLRKDYDRIKERRNGQYQGNPRAASGQSTRPSTDFSGFKRLLAGRQEDFRP